VARIIISSNPRPSGAAQSAPPAAPAPASPEVRRVLVDEAGEGQRLDNFLMRLL
jgi:23S rRNA pseudouridine955/2504/2580 synthase